MRPKVNVIGVYESCGSLAEETKDLEQRQNRYTHLTSDADKASYILIEVNTGADPVGHLLEMLGVDIRSEGAGMLREAVALCVKEPQLVDSVTKQLYPRVARSGGGSSKRVERSIRGTIEKSWPEAVRGIREQVFGRQQINQIRTRPANSEYIRRAAAYLRSMGASRNESEG